MRLPFSSRHLPRLAALPLLCVAVSCSPDGATTTAPVAPTAPAPRALLGLDPILTTTTTTLTGTVGTVTGTLTSTVGGLLGLLTCPSQDQLTATKYIGPLGGQITVGDHQLVIPAGALSETVKISATRVSGTVAEVDFQPHGLQFAKPATLRLSYGYCSAPSKNVQSIVYLNDKNEIIETPPSVDDSTADAVVGTIRHFSGYAIATRTPE